jgi:type I restriction enzyme M protein
MKKKSPQKTKIFTALTTLNLPSDHNIEEIVNDEVCKVVTVSNARGTEYLVVSVGAPYSSDAEHELRKAIDSRANVSVGVSLDEEGNTIRILRKSFRTGDFDYIAQLNVPNLLQPTSRITPKNLIPLNNKVENLLFEIHSAFRDIDGLHAPDALDEICKLIYAKLYDEENSTGSKPLVFQRNGYSSTEECAAEIRHLYIRAVNEDKAIFNNKIAGYERSRGVFRDQLLLSSPAIVRAVELIQSYDLSASPIDIKGRAFQNVLLPAVRSGMGQYFTPKEVIDLIVRIMSPQVRDLIIDPFCGSGHFLTSAIDFVRAHHTKSDKLFHEFAFTRLHGIEKSDRMVRIAMTDMRLHGDGHSNIRCTDSLLPFSNYPDLYRETFDLVLTNPPFGVDLSTESLSQLGPFSLAEGRKAALSLEIVALERCLQLLKPGGRLAIVLPDSVLSNKGTANVRSWILKLACIRAIFSLPNETFSPFGANIKTSVVVLRKLNLGEEPKTDHRIFLADLKGVGYDATGKPTTTQDISKAEISFLKFIEREGW